MNNQIAVRAWSAATPEAATKTKGSVLMVGNFLSASRQGFRGVCEELAARLDASGWHVLTTSRRSGRISRLLDMLSTVWRDRREYAVAQVDVYSGLAFLWAEMVCWLLLRAGKPYVLTLHGGALPTFAKRWPGRVRRLFASAVIVTTPSSYLLSQMEQYRSDLHLLSNPLDLSAYEFKLREHPAPKLVWLRSFHATYNPRMAPIMLAGLLQSHPDAHLTMIGPDMGDGSMQATAQLAQELGVADHFLLKGAVPKVEVPAWLAAGDIFLNTTNVDNTPVSVMEAMACGLCIVSTNVGGIPYLLEHEHDALLVPAGDAEAMKAAVLRILTEPGLAERLSRNARLKAAQLDWSLVLPQWETLLSTAMSRRTNV